MFKFDEAIAAYRKANRLNPGNGLVWNNLGLALVDFGETEEAIVAFREASRLRPDLPEIRYNFGNALFRNRDYSKSAAAFREAIGLRPAYAEAYLNLGIASQELDQGKAASAAFYEAKRLVGPDPALAMTIDSYLQQIDRQATLEASLPGVLKGMERPAKGVEYIEFAFLLYKKSSYFSSARLWSEGFSAEPSLMNDLGNPNLYNAACAAIRCMINPVISHR
jgi:tetratricopeptide (TPR) repeat protein